MEARMPVRRIALPMAVCAIGLLSLSGMQAQTAPGQGPTVTLKPGEVLPYNPDGIGRKGTGKATYNTAKAKLDAGGKIVGGTIHTNDPGIFCAMGNAGWDFLWIEMQHSPLTYEDVGRMLYACRGMSATPMLRVPDATEADVQKATDLGVLGIIVPTVETVEKAQASARWTRFPPVGRRSAGQNQAGVLWPNVNLRQTYNDNVLVVNMIETPEGVAIAEKIAAVPGVDVVFAASGDLGNFSGYAEGQPHYEALIARVHQATLKAGKKLGGPSRWYERSGFSFFQAERESVHIDAATKAQLAKMPGAGNLKK
jgi:2-keto-3-deoxy-L-rhamnonate aldolase RhmA